MTVRKKTNSVAAICQLVLSHPSFCPPLILRKFFSFSLLIDTLYRPFIFFIFFSIWVNTMIVDFFFFFFAPLIELFANCNGFGVD